MKTESRQKGLATITPFLVCRFTHSKYESSCRHEEEKKKQISTALNYSFKYQDTESIALIHKSSKKQTADIPGKCREMVQAVDAMFRKVEAVAFH